MTELGLRSQVKLGEESLPWMQHPELIPHRFLHFHNEVGAGVRLVAFDDTCSCPDGVFVAKVASGAGATSDPPFMACAYQGADAILHHAHTALAILLLFRNPDFHEHALNTASPTRD